MKVYLHADDFGLTKKITDDILECIDKGVINSISVMVNGYAFEYAMDELSKRKNISVSLHLNLDQGKCISNPGQIPLLANNNGYLTSSFESLFMGYYTGTTSKKKALKQQVAIEISSQIEKFLPFINRLQIPLSIDSERCTHMIPFILDEILELSQTYRISFLRAVWAPTYFCVRNTDDAKSYFSINIIKHILMNSINYCYALKKKLGEKKIAFADITFGLIHGGSIDKQLVELYINMALHRNAQTIQIIFHPFKPAPEEICFWQNYSAYNNFFRDKKRGIEKVFLLNEKAYFVNIANTHNG